MTWLTSIKCFENCSKFKCQRNFGSLYFVIKAHSMPLRNVSIDNIQEGNCIATSYSFPGSSANKRRATNIIIGDCCPRYKLRSSRSASNRPLGAPCTKTAAPTWQAAAIWTLLLFWPTVACSGQLDAALRWTKLQWSFLNIFLLC